MFPSLCVQLGGFLQSHRVLFQSSLEQASHTTNKDMVRCKKKLIFTFIGRLYVLVGLPLSLYSAYSTY